MILSRFAVTSEVVLSCPDGNKARWDLGIAIVDLVEGSLCVRACSASEIFKRVLAVAH